MHDSERFTGNSNTNDALDRPSSYKQLDDRTAIDQFLLANRGRQVVAVQGLGFVGAVMSLVCANAVDGDYAVIGVDLPDEDNRRKIQAFNEGVFPLTASDPKIGEFFERARATNSFYATYDPYAYSAADVIIVDINLDVQKQSGAAGELSGYDVDLSGFKAAMQTLAAHCKEDVLVLVETTVPPGTCEKVVKPILAEGLRARGLSAHGFALGHSYERVMPGPQYVDSIQSFYRVYSGIDDRSADATEAFLRTIICTHQYPLTRLAGTNATEMAKVLENSYRAMNIAFIVEWSRFAEEAGVDLYEVVNAIKMRPTHSNMMYPGIGVGGYCLTKDPLLAGWARQNLFGSAEALPQSETAVRINDRMPVFAFRVLRRHLADAGIGAGTATTPTPTPQELSGLRVVLLGVSYRGDVGDTRYSPVAPLYDCLTDAGAEVLLHDPYVRRWEEKERDVQAELTAVLAHNPDVIVISTGHSDYRTPEALEVVLAAGPALVYDTIGLYTAEQLTQLQTRHTVKVLGRGDL